MYWVYIITVNHHQSSHGVVKDGGICIFQVFDPNPIKGVKNGVITFESLFLTFSQYRTNSIHLYETGPQPFFFKIKVKACF